MGWCRVHPQTPSRGSLALLSATFLSTAEMDWGRVVRPRGLCRPLDEKQELPTRKPRRRSGKEANLRTRPFLTNPELLRHCKGLGSQMHLFSDIPDLWNPPKSLAARRNCSPRIPGGFTLLTVLTRRAAKGLGQSLERPCKWSAALPAV